MQNWILINKRYSKAQWLLFCLMLFLPSLKDKAKMWFNSLSKESIAMLEEMANKFLIKYFPPSKLVKLRGNITSFSQFDNEPIYELWKRYKDLIRKCSHHGLSF